jgi:hypothetical protein
MQRFDDGQIVVRFNGVKYFMPSVAKGIVVF